MKTSKSTEKVDEKLAPKVFRCDSCNHRVQYQWTMLIGTTPYGTEVRICPYCQDDYVLSEDRTAFKIKCGVEVKPFYE